MACYSSEQIYAFIYACSKKLIDDEDDDDGSVVVAAGIVDAELDKRDYCSGHRDHGDVDDADGGPRSFLVDLVNARLQALQTAAILESLTGGGWCQCFYLDTNVCEMWARR